MKVLLLKDVYNLGRAGEVKKVADGYGRNFLLPKNMAVLATPGMLKQVDRIRETATKAREMLNAEKAGLAEQLTNLELIFKARAGESGKLFGSITQQMIVDAIREKINVEIDRHQVESQPLREVGEHKVRVRLTFDLIPQVHVKVEAEEKEEPEAKDVKGKAPRKASKAEEKKEEKPVETEPTEAVAEVAEKVEEQVEINETKSEAAELQAEAAEEEAAQEKKTKKTKKSK